MKIIETAEQIKQLGASWRLANESVGFVPTMGALHQGHVALIARAQRECRQVVVSIFVNPTQFNDALDLERYPQPRTQDLELLERTQISAVFLPTAGEIYQDHYHYELHEKEKSLCLCGRTRPGHFAGVLTVVMKLLNLVRPQRAYFGEKDYQQFLLIREMARAFFMDTAVIPCPTVREADGLALSSRNRLLTPEQRERAPALHRILRAATTPAAAQRELSDSGWRVDYVEELWGRRFAAAYLGPVRLIDNVEI